MNFMISNSLYILATIGLTAYGQIILKWRLSQVGMPPDSIWQKIVFLVGLLFDPFVFSSFFSAALAAFAWMVALTKFDLSQAYPLMALNFVLVLLLSGWVLGESLSVLKLIGTFLIVFGTFVAVHG